MKVARIVVCLLGSLALLTACADSDPAFGETGSSQTKVSNLFFHSHLFYGIGCRCRVCFYEGDMSPKELMLQNAVGVERFIKILRKAGKIVKE